MSKILVLADDLTGAAEMAGIGVEYGLTARIARGLGASGAADAEMLVLDTDTRAMSPAHAAAKVTTALRQWAPGTHELIYKKTDSVLRGQIAAEVQAMMTVLGRKRTLLVPQNPSKGRVIVNGEYQINGIPLDQTDFRFDPESPITSARPDEILAPQNPGQIHIAPAGSTLIGQRFIVGNASSPDQVQHWAAQVDAQTLPAGGADFFRALLETRGRRPSPQPAIALSMDLTLIVCGSASAPSRNTVSAWTSQGQPVCPMPDDLHSAMHDQAPLSRWLAEINAHLQARKLAILAIRQKVDNSRAVDLRECMARAVRHLVSDCQTSDKSLRLFVEGGATAAAICAALRWDKCDVAGTIAPGVVVLRPPIAPRVRMIIKPGSYPWPTGAIDSW